MGCDAGLGKVFGPRAWRVGAPWLYLSCDRSPQRNAADTTLNANPKTSSLWYTCRSLSAERINDSHSYRSACAAAPGEELDDRLFARCIDSRRDFHIDPYGRMTFCCFVKALDALRPSPRHFPRGVERIHR